MMNEFVGVSVWIHPPVKNRVYWLVEVTTKEGVGKKEFETSAQAFEFIEGMAEKLSARLGPMRFELYNNKENKER